MDYEHTENKPGLHCCQIRPSYDKFGRALMSLFSHTKIEHLYTIALGFSNCRLAVPSPSVPPSWFSPSHGFRASPNTPSVP